MQRRAIVISVLSTMLLLSSAEAQSPPAKIDFNRDIRPLLSEFCFKCHGPDATQREADLRLDTKHGAFRNRDGSFAVVSGKPAESELYLRLTADADDTRMPPPETGRKLSPQQIGLFMTMDRRGGSVGTALVLPTTVATEAPVGRAHRIRPQCR